MKISRLALDIRERILEAYPKCEVAIYPEEEDMAEMFVILVRPKSRLRQVRDFIENLEGIPIEMEFDVFTD